MNDLRPRLVFALVLLAGISMALLRVLLPQFDTLATADLTFDRESAISLALEQATVWGFPAEGWKPTVTAHIVQTPPPTALFPDAGRRPRFFSTIRTKVKLEDPTSQNSVTVWLDERGRILSFWRSLPDDDRADSPDHDNERLSLAEEALTRLTGENPSAFELRSTETTEKGGTRYRWRRPIPGVDLVELEVSCELQGAELVWIRASPAYNEKLQSALSTKQLAVVLTRQLPSRIPFILVWIAAVVATIISWKRRAVDLRSALILTVCSATVLIFSTKWPDAPFELFAEILFFLIFFAPYPALLWCGGFVQARRTAPDRLLGAELLLRGAVSSRPVGVSIFSGLAIGPLLVLLPCLVVATGWFQGAFLVAGRPGLVMAGRFLVPALANKMFFAASMVALTFSFLAPWFEDSLTSMRLVRVLTLIVATPLLTSNVVIDGSVAAIMTTALLLAVVYDLIWRRFGLLSVITASATGIIAVHTVILTGMQSPFLQKAGDVISGVTVLLFVAAMVVAMRGRQIGIEVLPPALGQPRAERDRIRAELRVAHDAQMSMGAGI